MSLLHLLIACSWPMCLYAERPATDGDTHSAVRLQVHNRGFSHLATASHHDRARHHEEPDIVLEENPEVIHQKYDTHFQKWRDDWKEKADTLRNQVHGPLETEAAAAIAQSAAYTKDLGLNYRRGRDELDKAVQNFRGKSHDEHQQETREIDEGFKKARGPAAPALPEKYVVGRAFPIDPQKAWESPENLDAEELQRRNHQLELQLAEANAKHDDASTELKRLQASIAEGNAFNETAEEASSSAPQAETPSVAAWQ